MGQEPTSQIKEGSQEGWTSNREVPTKYADLKKSGNLESQNLSKLSDEEGEATLVHYLLTPKLRDCWAEGTNSTPNTQEKTQRNVTLKDRNMVVKEIPYSNVDQKENKEIYTDTPKRRVLPGQIIYPKRLFKEKRKLISFEQRNKIHKINKDEEEMDV